MFARVFKRYNHTKTAFYADAVAEGPRLLSLCFRSSELVCKAKQIVIGDLISVSGSFDLNIVSPLENDHREFLIVDSFEIISSFQGY